MVDGPDLTRPSEDMMRTALKAAVVVAMLLALAACLPGSSSAAAHAA
jgi:hypothetical protein